MSEQKPFYLVELQTKDQEALVSMIYVEAAAAIWRVAERKEKERGKKRRKERNKERKGKKGRERKGEKERV